MVNIYTLEDPVTLQIKYVGKTTNTLERRLSCHIQDRKRFSHKCANWIKSLIRQNKKPIIKLVDTVSIEDSNFYEIYWINQFKVWGFELKNETLGGDGASLGLPRSKEAKFKTSATLKQKYDNKEIVFTEKRRQLISNRLKGRKLKEKTKELLRLANLGKKQSSETIIKKSKVVYQYTLNNESINSYNSVTEAALAVNGTKGNISNCIFGRNRMKSYKGYIWKYDKI